MKKILIDGHEDIAYAALSFNRDYTTSAADIRLIDQFTEIPQWNGHAMLGYADWQKANVGIIFTTLFAMHKRYQTGDWEKMVYRNSQEADSILRQQIDYYYRLEGNFPEKFVILRNNTQYLNHWEQLQNPSQNFYPIGLVLLLEGAEGLLHPEEIEDWYQKGVRIVGPAWAGGKYSGGMYEPGGLTKAGRLLLEIMIDLRMGLDVAHMSEQAVYQAMEIYDGPVLSSHANVKSLINGVGGERHLSDPIIRRIAERDGVMGVMPYNQFLVTNWTNLSARDKVTLEHYVDHIDHICQVTGSANHVAIGTDFDGGFGYPDVPFELISIGDLPQVDTILATRGYNQDEIHAIFALNWKRILDRIFSK
ncbi:MAG: membrane dipeptidase [Anaerolineaceae bacterium]|nr:membrane dipeptidase [Anaerolineaceae bacterium]